MKLKRILVILNIVLLLIFLFGMTALAAGSGDVAGAVESTWNDASSQIKTVVNKVVFPAIDLILAVCFFAKLGTAYFDYRKHGEFEFAAPAILFACLVFTLTCPLYIWQVLGMQQKATLPVKSPVELAVYSYFLPAMIIGINIAKTGAKVITSLYDSHI